MSVISAKEFLELEENYDVLSGDKDSIERALIEFAKLHVKAALDSVYNAGLDGVTTWFGNPYTFEGSDYLSQTKIHKTYPLENIK